MKAAHRKVHRIAWWLLTPLLVAGLAAAILGRQPFAQQDPPAIDRTPTSKPPAQEVPAR
ncbi:MAG: hypothetical protein H6830_02610 [Planctomycetes bacterium]|nr:hypothetical protein [Planctomycetota bacterium]MCB9910166.1 hypothetical protein [Planctomycetota bacterium]HPF15317.1 hypothetical protein [Planctomycetota bacterium]HRV81114.1 hypothetical protein [Planctomycetota bacterium]